METNLLRYLVQHEGQVVSRKSMLEDVWNLREDTDTRAIDHFIARLRKYIENEPAQAEARADRPRRRLQVRRGAGGPQEMTLHAASVTAVTPSRSQPAN